MGFLLCYLIVLVVAFLLFCCGLGGLFWLCWVVALRCVVAVGVLAGFRFVGFGWALCW